MGSSPLRQFLIGLCNNTPWQYSVFWKLKHQTPLVLMWEDGYYDDTKPEETWEIKSYDNYMYTAEGKSLPSIGTSMQDNKPEGTPVRLVMANMARFQYAFGEGLVGEVAYTGNHMWVSLNSFCSREFENNLHTDSMDEWLALGIKTLLLVPAFPDGVIQLGSVEEVAENIAVVDLVKDRFDAYRKMIKTVTFLSTQPLSSSSPVSAPIEKLNISTCKQLKVEKLEDFASEKMNGKTFQTVPDSSLETEKDAPDIFKNTSGDEIGFLEELFCPSLCLSENNLGIGDNKVLGFSCMEEDLLSHLLYSGQNMEFLGEPLNEYPAGEMEIQLFGSGHIDEGRYKSRDCLYKFDEDCELHKALGPAYLENNTHEKMWGSSFLIEDSDGKSNVVCDEDHVGIAEPSSLTRVCDSEYLLDAVIANLFSSSDGPSSDSTPSCITSLIPSSFSQRQEQSKEVPETGICSDHCSRAAPAAFDRVDSSASLDGMTSTLTNEDKQVKGHARASSSKSKKSNIKTSRAKNGSNLRPRPRDRQLIQDRVKELRELIPSGSKCSIDGLLDRTIKHMVYLRSVADQAEKLKGTVHHEVENSPQMASRKNRKSSETNSTSQNGTSWAFEFGSDNQVCPIVVEDLECPGHMLIEVLCDDHGLFLEIAQLIRRLDLTILKGAMENNSSKTWANFVVEATKGFHRMEIFWPLLHLLQRKRSRISSRI